MTKAIKLTDKVWWVGAIDWGIRDFHGYSTHRGTTYNAYLIVADKITLIDTVKAPFKDEMMARIASVINPLDIDYIVSNHAEMDHSGSLPQVINEVRPEAVYASQMGADALNKHFDLSQKISVVPDAGTLNLGNLNLRFYETKMLHWPDSMFTYLEEEQILFSQDAFGMHLASSERYDDELPQSLLEYEAANYYANILTPFSMQVTKLHERLTKLNFPIKMLAPDHGPIWRSNIDRIIELYATWAQQKASKKAVIAYATMWEATAKLARAIGSGIMEQGISIKIMPLENSTRSDIAAQLLSAGAFVIGSPTINNQIFPTMADTLCYIKGLKFKNLIGAAFGSYGWSGEATKHMKNTLTEMNLDVIPDELKVKYQPTKDDLNKAFLFGSEIGKKILAIAGES